VTGPLARTVRDIALMLSAIAGPDDRAPISYEIDTSQLARAVRAPSVKGWRIAWAPDLHGLLPVDEEVANVAQSAMRVFRSLGAKVETASPDFSEMKDIVRGTRAVTMVAMQADKLPGWREKLQKDLVRDIDQGLTATARTSRAARRCAPRCGTACASSWRAGSCSCCRRWRCPRFRWSSRIRPKSTENAERLYRVVLPHIRNHADWPAGDLGAVRFHASGLPVGLQLVGRRRQEAAVLTAAAAFEVAAPWADRLPPVLGARLTAREHSSSR
jgi:amidase